MALRILYLHGLGGSPRSSKGLLVAAHFKRRGIETELPALAIPSLQELSPLSIVQFVTDDLARMTKCGPVALVGSSFGAFVAMHALTRASEPSLSQVQAVALLAPVFDPWDEGSTMLSPEIERRWKLDGSYPILDLENQRPVPIHYRFVEELQELSVAQTPSAKPTLIIHGRRDTTVSPAQSERAVKGKSNVQLEVLDDDHRLLAQPERLMGLLEDFILKRASSPPE